MKLILLVFLSQSLSAPIPQLTSIILSQGLKVLKSDSSGNVHRASSVLQPSATSTLPTNQISVAVSPSPTSSVLSSIAPAALPTNQIPVAFGSLPPVTIGSSSAPVALPTNQIAAAAGSLPQSPAERIMIPSPVTNPVPTMVIEEPKATLVAQAVHPILAGSSPMMVRSNTQVPVGSRPVAMPKALPGLPQNSRPVIIQSLPPSLPPDPVPTPSFSNSNEFAGHQDQSTHIQPASNVISPEPETVNQSHAPIALLNNEGLPEQGVTPHPAVLVNRPESSNPDTRRIPSHMITSSTRPLPVPVHERPPCWPLLHDDVLHSACLQSEQPMVTPQKAVPKSSLSSYDGYYI